MSSVTLAVGDTAEIRNEPAIRVLAVVDSWQGHTARVAERVAAGIRAEGASAVVRSADDAARADLIACDALMMGSAVHQRAMTWKLKRFVDEACEPAWLFDDLVGRVGTVFTAGGGAGGAGGGAEAAQLGMLTNLASCGMILVSLPRDALGSEHGGIQWGPTIKTTTDDMQPIDPDKMAQDQQLAFYHHGANVVRAANRLRGLTFAAANRTPSPECRAMRAKAEEDHPLDTRWGHLADPKGSIQ
jgi:NAD(P)H dehydrogenase (quinone)